MRAIDLIVIHCSSTRENYALTEQALEAVSKVGAHARGYNAHSIGICYEGGLDRYGNPKDTRTEWQRHSLSVLVGKLLQEYPGTCVVGHRDLSPDLNGNGEVEPMEWTKQ